MSTFGRVIHISLFGESHGEAVGVVISNLPSGLSLDKSLISNALFKRRPKSKLSTSRQEKDEYKIISGYFNNKTTGTPLTIIIPNEDTRSKDYTPEVLRPSHADYTGRTKYENYNDYRGSGHFSGRLTAPLVILGAICEQILKNKGITIASHISSIKNLSDVPFNEQNTTYDNLKTLNLSDFPVINTKIADKFKQLITEAKENNDSVGGTIETAVLGLNPGYGEPFFDSVESILSHLIFSIPGVKGIEFGKGFAISELYGSEANDQFFIENGNVKTKTNNSGGIQGGISNGMPIIFKTAIKPTSSIGKRQTTVNIETLEEVTIELKGRHDPAIVHRAVHVVTAMANYALLEIIVRSEGTKWMK
jgi:chorismate synthase